MDDHVIQSMEPGVYRLMNQPLKYHGNPVIRLDQDWEHKLGLSHAGDCAQIFWDQDRKLYRFYGMMVNWDWSKNWLFYAESKDGIHWKKPPLGQVELEGHDTNFIRLSFGKDAWANTVFRDPNGGSQDQYKMIYFEERGEKKGMYPAYSSDGLHWKAYDVDRPAVPYWSDTTNNLMWDPKKERYILYLRTFNKLSRWMEAESLYPEGARVRTAGFATSTDFLNWDSPPTIRDADDRFISFHADEKDPVGSRDFYTLEVLPYLDGYVGFTSVYHNMMGVAPAAMDTGQCPVALDGQDGCSAPLEPGRGALPADGTPAGLHSQRAPRSLGPGPGLFRARRDRPGGRGRGLALLRGIPGTPLVLSSPGAVRRVRVGLAILRLDGFVAITGKGALTTRPLRFQGRALEINATGVDKYVGPDYGTVRVEVLDGSTGQPVAGFTKDDSDPFGGDEIRHTVSWKGKSDLKTLTGKTIQLRFHLDKAKLFAFQFVD